MSKFQKKKAPVVEEEPEVEIVTRVEYTYEDTKCIVGVEPEYQWGDIYRLIMRREVPDSDRFAGCTCGENPCICNHDNE